MATRRLVCAQVDINVYQEPTFAVKIKILPRALPLTYVGLDTIVTMQILETLSSNVLPVHICQESVPKSILIVFFASLATSAQLQVLISQLIALQASTAWRILFLQLISALRAPTALQTLSKNLIALTEATLT
jgi:hypothetical protein